MSFTVFRDGKKVEQDFSSAKTVQDLVRQLRLNPETIIVKRNGKLVHPASVLADGDAIDLIGIIYGG